MLQSLEQISVNLHSSNVSMSSSHRSGTGGRYKSGGKGASMSTNAGGIGTLSTGGGLGGTNF